MMAIAVTQIYGQLRTQRYKELGDAEIRRISAGVNRISAGVNSIGSDIGNLAAYLAAKEEESGS